MLFACQVLNAGRSSPFITTHSDVDVWCEFRTLSTSLWYIDLLIVMCYRLVQSTQAWPGGETHGRTILLVFLVTVLTMEYHMQNVYCFCWKCMSMCGIGSSNDCRPPNTSPSSFPLARWWEVLSFTSISEQSSLLLIGPPCDVRANFAFQ